MVVKNNYNDCLTNLACSIQKYFGLKPKHNTITAATTSIRTGLNPVEHGWLGWNMYMAPIDKTITLFRNKEKGKDEVSDAFLKVKSKLVQKTLVDEINENTSYYAMELFPFGENKYHNLDEMLAIIEKQSQKEGKKYIYAYDDEPDHSMHDFGLEDSRVKELIEIRNNKVEQLCHKVKDSIVIIIADHGHKEVEPIFLKDYPAIMEMLERTTSIEQRAVSFKIKKDKKEHFAKEFNQNFGRDFTLYSQSEILEAHLFGEGEENELFKSAIGDFLAIAEDSNKCIITKGDKVVKSQHAGYSEDELYVPLIVVDKCENKNSVIGIEGTVGAGKTSICRQLLGKIENSILLHGGNIYRAIAYGINELHQNKQEIKVIDAFEIMKQLEIEIKLENRETVVYSKGKQIEEKDLQSDKISMLVSQVSNVAKNEKLYQLGKDLIDQFRKNYHVILSSRDIVKMYPEVTYHFFIDASIEERVNRKYRQYNKKIEKEKIREMIEERDRLQEESGYYEIYPKTQIIDVTNCKTPEESAKKVWQKIEDFREEKIK